jgi:hypothetical protein
MIEFIGWLIFWVSLSVVVGAGIVVGLFFCGWVKRIGKRK